MMVENRDRRGGSFRWGGLWALLLCLLLAACSSNPQQPAQDGGASPEASAEPDAAEPTLTSPSSGIITDMVMSSAMKSLGRAMGASATKDQAKEVTQGDQDCNERPLGKGTLVSCLQEMGISTKDTFNVVSALEGMVDFKSLRPKTKVRLEKSDGGDMERLAIKVAMDEIYEVIREGNLFRARKREVAVTTRTHSLGGRIESSLYQAIDEAGEKAKLAQFFVDVMSYDVDFYHDTKPGDTFRIVVEKTYVKNEFLRYGRILAAEYEGKVGKFRVFHHPGPPEGFYDEQGRSAKKSFMRMPLRYNRVSSRFNPKRLHPVLRRVKAHQGTDFAAPTGTPVWAAADGVVTFVGKKGGYGNLVIINHNNGLVSYYGHLHRFAKNMKKGVRVVQKQVVGTVGMTGLATGPHLHFGLTEKGRWIDPLQKRFSPGPPVAASQRSAFMSRMREYATRLAGVDLP